MAKPYVRTLSNKWRDEYKRNPDFWSNKDEYTKVGELEERREELREARQSNCYWGVDGGEFISWDEKADHNMKGWSMWKKAYDQKDPRPNLKSTFTYNAVETAMTELYDVNLMPAVTPWTKKGEKYADTTENIIKYPIIKHNFNDTWLSGFKEALILGNAFFKVDYTKIKRKKKLKKLKDFDKKQLKQMEKDGEIAIYQDQMIVEHNDVNWTHIPFHEYFPDGYARKQHGLNHSAIDGLHEYTVSYDSFKAMFGNRREFKNVDKVIAGYERLRNNPLFDYPDELHDTNNVVIQEWEHKTNDFRRYVANGVWLGDIPLPNHGQLSVVHIGCFEFPHQYYHMGLADIIEGLQAEEEVIRNKFLELLELNLTPPIIANNQIAGEFKEQYETAKYNVGDIISISGNPQEIQWMAPAISKLSEIFNMRETIKEDVISVSLIDPRASSQPSVKTETATETMAMMQATMKSFAKTIKNFSRGIKTGLNLQWALQRQEYPLTMEPEEINKRKGSEATEKKKVFKDRIIFTQDVEITTKDGKIETKKSQGDRYPFEIKNEYLDLEDHDMDIIISPESMAPESKIANIRKTEEAWAQLFPVYAADAEAKGIPPMEDERIKILHKDYVIAHKLDRELLLSEGEDEEDAVSRATKQHNQMYKNAGVGIESDRYKPVIGEYDEPVAHINVHLKAMKAVDAVLQKKMAERDGMVAEAQSMMEIGQQPTQQMTQEFLKISDQITMYESLDKQLEEHLLYDQMSEQEAVNKELSEATGMQPGQMMVGGMGGAAAQGPMGGPIGEMPMTAAPSIPGPTPVGQADMTQMAM